jgi:hypothetical protein
MGVGGLHSNESGVTHIADDSFVLRDHDVESYYPRLIEYLGIYPPQIGPAFSDIYVGWIYRRIAAKHEGDKKTANSLKITLNGTFGKLGSPYSIFYAPQELLNVTITGQLSLLMLIERLELYGIPVISANTDGIVLKCPRELEWLADEIIAAWERETCFKTERTDYSATYSRDVNSYIAVKTDGEIKLKGAFAPAEPGASGWPNPTGQICVDAMVEYLTKGVQIEHTIRSCKDIRQFLYVREVKGGGSVVRDPVLDKNATQRAKIASHGSIAAYDAAVAIPCESEYLGKVVRWYYAVSSTATIRYGSGNLVPRTLGCEPCMELPDVLPADIDYNWYVAETISLLEGVGKQ